LATILREVRGAELARLSPRVERAESDWQATVTLGCPRWQQLAVTTVGTQRAHFSQAIIPKYSTSPQDNTINICLGTRMTGFFLLDFNFLKSSRNLSKILFRKGSRNKFKGSTVYAPSFLRVKLGSKHKVNSILMYFGKILTKRWEYNGRNLTYTAFSETMSSLTFLLGIDV
jgi:hypothetical protein